jgi:hypothetical protein
MIDSFFSLSNLGCVLAKYRGNTTVRIYGDALLNRPALGPMKVASFMRLLQRNVQLGLKKSASIQEEKLHSINIIRYTKRL